MITLIKIYDKDDTGRDVSYVNPEEIAGITVFLPENKTEGSTIVIPDEFKEKASQIMLKSGKILTGEPRFVEPLIKKYLGNV